MSKFPIAFYKKYWNTPLIQHIRELINSAADSSIESIATTIFFMSAMEAPSPNSYEDCLDMIKKIKQIQEENNIK